jgi:hypothetical protein
MTSAMTPDARDARALGSIFDEWSLERAVEAMLRPRVGQWLDETAHQQGDNVRVARPKSWTTDDRLAGYPESQLPRIIITAPTTAGSPTRSGGGKYRATYNLGVGAIIAGASRDSARHRASVYGAALRALVLHHLAAACPQIVDVWWAGSGNNDLPDLLDKKRQLAVTDQGFLVTVDGIVNDTAGAPLFDPDPDSGGPVDAGEQPLITTVRKPVVTRHAIAMERTR